jgi:outer membrane protein OmpA-like peptidoglycan-associated protein
MKCIQLTLLAFLISIFASAQNPSQTAKRNKAAKKAARHSKHEPYEYVPSTHDSDGDGVEDYTDKCPGTPRGTKVTTFGCPPDTDFDGIYDDDDQCVNEPGPKDNRGCPYGDKDKDGILDKDDDCPDVAGLAKFKGCPDTDKDGLMDAKDKCPNEYGPIEFGGCPDTDVDGDGVPDHKDLCPKTPGVISNKGCPQMSPEQEKALKHAFDNLLFESGKDIIMEGSYASLNELGKVLIKDEKAKLYLEGHTDDVGNDHDNLDLSRRRAISVKKYLTDMSVSESRIRTDGFGETRPICLDPTDECRKKNRRVEMNIYYE